MGKLETTQGPTVPSLHSGANDRNRGEKKQQNKDREFGDQTSTDSFCLLNM